MIKRMAPKLDKWAERFENWADRLEDWTDRIDPPGGQELEERHQRREAKRKAKQVTTGGE